MASARLHTFPRVRVCAARDAANSTLSKVAQQVVDALELAGGPGDINWVRLFDVLSCMGAEPNTTLPLPPTATPTIIKQIFQQVGLWSGGGACTGEA